MTRYKRFVKTCTSEDDFQAFFDSLTKEGWRIIYYNEESHGEWGDKQMYIHLRAVCEKSENQIL
jgi:hypothetical protein